MGLFDFLRKKPEAPQGPDAEVEALVRALQHSEWKTRFDAANKLAALGTRAAPAQSALEDATSDESNEVCTAAAAALSAIRKALLGH